MNEISGNPYQSPQFDSGDASQANPATQQESARAVFLAWEKLRLVYNGLLGIISLLFGVTKLGDLTFWEFLVGGALAVNVGFCLGPVAEGYLALMGAPRHIARWVIFVPGTLLSCFVAIVCVLTWRSF